METKNLLILGAVGAVALFAFSKSSPADMFTGGGSGSGANTAGTPFIINFGAPDSVGGQKSTTAKMAQVNNVQDAVDAQIAVGRSGGGSVSWTSPNTGKTTTYTYDPTVRYSNTGLGASVQTSLPSTGGTIIGTTKTGKQASYTYNPNLSQADVKKMLGQK